MIGCLQWVLLVGFELLLWLHREGVEESLRHQAKRRE